MKTAKTVIPDKPVVIIDGANFMHRARSGFTSGEYAVVYNFFRQLKALAELFDPVRVIFTMEGHPKKKLETLPEYKANRDVDVSTEKGQEKQKTLEDFYRQARIVTDLLQAHFPVSVVQHPDHEADDLIHNIVASSSSAVPYVVVSSDTDFIQMLQRFEHVQLYNPITKAFVAAPEHDYVFWKALRGDGSDNIPALPGVNDDRATELMADPDALHALLAEHGDAFNRNVSLIRLADFTDEELLQVRSSEPIRNWTVVWAAFDSFGFKSILKEGYWDKFVAVFDRLWIVEANTCTN